jgi:hypothetical protein
MKARERLAHHGFIKEAIVDTLNDNNEQAFRQLDKVIICDIYLLSPSVKIELTFIAAFYVACQRLVLLQDDRTLAEKPRIVCIV